MEKTPLQEIIPYLNGEIKEIALKLLEKEQKQFEDAYQIGYDCGVQWLCTYKSAKDYYEQKYGKR